METAYKSPISCRHYRRHCKIVAECCQLKYPCVHCHDEVSDHDINRKEISRICCNYCKKVQPVSENCFNCKLLFGMYSCLECVLFDDNEKDRYHCPKCNLCILAKPDEAFHCEECRMCYPVKIKEGHECTKNIGDEKCPVCLQEVRLKKCYITKCDHLIHDECFNRLTSAGHFVCPTCESSMFEMTSVWRMLDDEIAEAAATRDKTKPSPPKELIPMVCRDCANEAIALNHPFGMKCTECGSYNTARWCPPKGDVINYYYGESDSDITDFMDTDEEGLHNPALPYYE